MTLRHTGLGATSVGRKREHNEDSHYVDDNLGLYIVADGMGGHAAGEVASQLAVKVVHEVISQGRSIVEALAREPSHENKLAGQKLVEKAIQEACARVHKEAQSDRAKRGMGTTFVCVLVAGNRAVLGHVGDSRVYFVRQTKVHRLTEDHTMMAMALKAGLIKKEDLAESDWANSLTRAVGPQPSVQVDTLLVECQANDRFLLCSDGLHGYLQDEEVPALLGGLGTATTVEKLVDLSNERGGKDNITALLVTLSGDPTPTLMVTGIDTRMGILERIPLFAFLNYKERSVVLSVSTMKSFAAGAEIVVEKAEGDDLFIVVSGKVAVEKAGQRIGELQAGGHFGEMGLVDHAPRSATVRALEATECMVIGRTEMMNLMRKEQMLAVKLLWSFVQTLSERLRIANTGMVARADAPFDPSSEV